MQDYFAELLSTKEFAYENLGPWNRPAMYGFVQFDEISLPQNTHVQHIIISRRLVLKLPYLETTSMLLNIGADIELELGIIKEARIGKVFNAIMCYL